MSGGGSPAWRERLALDAPSHAPAASSHVVWIHGASVGESASAEPLVRAVLARCPEVRVVWSAQTATGRVRVAALCGRLSGDERARVHVRRAPLDLPGVPSRALARTGATSVVFVETEIWPVWLAAAHDAGCRVAWASARLGDRSLPRYARLKQLLAPLLAKAVLVAAQTERDAAGFVALGADPSRVQVLGSLKADVLAGPPPADVLRSLAGRRVVIAGSTRPGEEEILLASWRRVHDALPDAVLVLAPRHLDRVRDVERVSEAHGFRTVLRTRLGDPPCHEDVLLLDTHGELASLYVSAEVAILGGSLRPFGGHNPLEAASAGVPLLCGPHTASCADVVAALVEAGAAQSVTSERDVADACIALLTDGAGRAARAEAARAVAARSRGVAGRIVDALVACGVLPAGTPAPVAP